MTDNPSDTPGSNEPSRRNEGEWTTPPPPSSEPNWASQPGGGATPPPAGGSPQGGLIACLILGVLEAICCCWPGTPFGIAAVVLSALGLSKNGKGDVAGARAMRKWAIIALLVGLALWLAYVIYNIATNGDAAYNQILDSIRAATSTTLPSGFPEVP